MLYIYFSSGQLIIVAKLLGFILTLLALIINLRNLKRSIKTYISLFSYVIYSLRDSSRSYRYSEYIYRQVKRDVTQIDDYKINNILAKSFNKISSKYYKRIRKSEAYNSIFKVIISRAERYFLFISQQSYINLVIGVNQVELSKDLQTK